mgnify:CR=1 FL=1
MKDSKAIVRRLVTRFVFQMGLSILWSVLATGAIFLLAHAVTVAVPYGRALLSIFTAIIPLEIWPILLLAFFYVFFLAWYQYVRFKYYGEMIAAVRSIADGNLELKVPERQRDDFGVLAADINALLDRLRRSMEEERRAEQTKNELITNVSHDLRTPLTSILGYLGLIEEDRYRDEVELRHYVGIAYAKARRLHVLINDLFEYTRMRHGRVPLKPERLNLGELLGQLLAQYRLDLEKADMTATLAVPRGEEAVVIGDPDKLVRVFENLLTNAMRYGREGKRIDIAVRIEAAEAAVDVVNYGEPISPADLPYIFERFYRADKSRTEDAGQDPASPGGAGSGLGLAIAKSIVEQHGGTIGAFSDERATVFRVRLPLAGSDVRAEREGSAAAGAS